jgi:transposase
MAAYSLDLRKRIVDAIERGVGTRGEVARLFGVHESFVYKLLRQKRELGHSPRCHTVAALMPNLTKIS